MCGRYTVTRPAEILEDVRARLLDAGLEAASATVAVTAERYNVAPTQAVPVACSSDGSVTFGLARWGFEGSGRERRQLINARVETVAEKPSFAKAFATRRCLLPADGFYEWDETSRQPHYFSLPAREPFCFAGLWQEGEVEVAPPPGAASSEPLQRSVCIVTAPAVPRLAFVHPRMPLILAAADWPIWLGSEVLGRPSLETLVQASPAKALAIHPVSYDVNRVAVDSPALVAKAAPAPRNLSLF